MDGIGCQIRLYRVTQPRMAGNIFVEPVPVAASMASILHASKALCQSLEDAVLGRHDEAHDCVDVLVGEIVVADIRRVVVVYPLDIRIHPRKLAGADNLQVLVGVVGALERGYLLVPDRTLDPAQEVKDAPPLNLDQTHSEPRAIIV